MLCGSLIIWLISSNLPAFGQRTFDEKLESLYKKTVPLVQPEELLQFEKSDNSLVILDTRSAEEFSISHLPEARFIDYDRFKISDVENIAKDTRIILYCSVGYRSERIGEKLLKAGFKEVYNLYGGIFQWKNDGHQVVNNLNKPTDSVHTYNEKWSKWLEKGIKVY